MFKQSFLRDLHDSFGKQIAKMVEEGNSAAARYMDDDLQDDGINYREILEATSLSDLKNKAHKIELRMKVYSDFTSGRCYMDEGERRKKCGCPRLYGQMNSDDETLKNFECWSVSYIPSCPKFKSGECWERFDALGLQMK